MRQRSGKQTSSGRAGSGRRPPTSAAPDATSRSRSERVRSTARWACSPRRQSQNASQSSRSLQRKWPICPTCPELASISQNRSPPTQDTTRDKGGLHRLLEGAGGRPAQEVGPLRPVGAQSLAAPRVVAVSESSAEVSERSAEAPICLSRLILAGTSQNGSLLTDRVSGARL